MSNVSRKNNIFNLCFCGVMIALATALSFVKMFEMPLGGSVTLCSMLPIMIVGYFLGVKWGAVSAFVFAFLQAWISLGEVMSWGLSSAVLVACILLDYIIPYTALGFSGVFKGKFKKLGSYGEFFVGMALVVFIRFISHIISGIALFSSWALFQPSWLYSICYNGAYLLPDLIICIIIGAIIFKPLNRLMNKAVK